MATLTSLSHQQATESVKVRVGNGNFVRHTNLKPDVDGKDSQQKSSSTAPVDFVRVIQSILLLFKDYLRQLGMVTMAMVVAILACSLKGIYIQQTI